ncbi:MAG: hypothetical protein IJP90_15755, partial [Treponema sp.]|nr:hypothetical protein [Treponema sp.]
MEALSVLLSILAAVAVSFVMKKLGGGNPTNDNIRVFIENKKKEIEKMFEERGQRMNALSASLETQQAQAVAAVNRLEGQIEEFKKASSEFDKQFDAVDNIGQKIDAYGKVLNELMEMTENVEENLLRLKKESSIIDKLNSRLNAQEKAVERLDVEIPKVSANFEKYNNESLKLIGTKLLDQYKEQAKSLEDATSAVEAKASELLKNIENDIREAYQQAVNRAKTLEDMAFDQLAESAESRKNSVIKIMDDQTRQLANQIDSQVLASQKAGDARIAEVEQELRQRLAAVTENIGNDVSQFNQDATQKINAIKANVENEVANFTQNANQKISTVTADVESSVSNLAQSTTDKVNEIKTNVENSISGLSQATSEKVTAIRETVENEINTLDSSVKEKSKALNQQFTQGNAEIRQMLHDALSAAKGTAKELAAESSKNSKSLEVLRERFTKLVQPLQEKYENIYQKAIADADEKEKAAYAHWQEISDNHLSEFKTRVEEKINGMQTEVVDRVNNFTNGISEKQTEVESKVSGLVESVETRFSNLSNGIESKFEE